MYDSESNPVVIIENWVGLKNQHIALSLKEFSDKIEFILERP